MTQQPYQFTEFPERSRDDLTALYDTQAPTYRAQITFVDRYLGVAGMRGRLFAKARGDVLDVACGTGENFRHLPQNIRSLTAVDLSPGMVKLAGDEARKLGLTATVTVMDAQALDFPDSQFDTVITSLATCTFPDPLRALDEMARVCKPDGRILLVEHGRSRVKWIARLQDRFAHGQFNAHACRWNQDSLVLVKASGLRVVEAKTRLFGILHAIEAAPSETAPNA
jgi:ubiquinone/menaquinone biosynthesis C-methylase UbiE